MLWEYLSKVGPNLEESLLWFKLLILHLSSLPLAPLLLVEVLRLLVVDELLQQLLIVWMDFAEQDYLWLCTLLEEVKKVALALLRNILSTLRVNSIHCHQHPLIFTPMSKINFCYSRVGAMLHLCWVLLPLFIWRRCPRLRLSKLAHSPFDWLLGSGTGVSY